MSYKDFIKYSGEYLLTSKESLEIDEITQNIFGVDSIVLMELAGKGVADFTDYLLKKDFESKILVVCGVGNNGGDGFVVAKHLFQKGYNISLFFIGDEKKLKKDSRTNFDIAKKFGVNFISESEFLSEISKFSVIIDGIFGVGLDRDINGVYKRVIDLINHQKKLSESRDKTKKLQNILNKNRVFFNNKTLTIISIDIPSGVHGTTGEIFGVAVKADYSITFGFYKIAHFFNSGLDYCGEVIPIDISFPKNAIDYLSTKPIKLVTERYIIDLIPESKRDSYKNKNGHLFIFGGGENTLGAPIISSKGAFSVGVGLVTLTFQTDFKEKTINFDFPEVMIKSFHNSFDFLIKNVNCFLFGPGVIGDEINSTDKDSVEKIKNFFIYLWNKNIPLVIDGGGLDYFIFLEKNLSKRDSPVIITPHLGEFSRLTGLSVSEIKKDAVNTVLEFAKKFNVVTVLKSSTTIIASPDGEIFLNPFGNEGLSTAGSGDFLAGVISGFLSQNISPLNSAILGTYFHGKGGELTSLKLSKKSMKATDIEIGIKELWLKIEQNY
ncbi:NAD(P)H-hydrate dehydratase [bacterium]|nr:NAD(P)H-hydrate dehydratase [bacterium]